MIEILTDSCSDLNLELYTKHGIRFISLPVLVNEKTYRDRVEITTPELFAAVKQSGKLPKTSAPSVADFIEFFNASTADEIIFIGISAKLSATLQSATIAAESTKKKVFLFDSFNLSTGIALQVLKAAEMRDAGNTSAEILNELTNIRQRIHTSFVIDTMEYLHMGGRCTAMQNLVGSLLKIRPVIEVRNDGTLGVKDKVGGARKKALNKMLEDFGKNAANLDTHRVFVTHTGCDDDAQYLKEEILKIKPIDELLITTTGATVSSHCGPNTIGIIYITR